MPAAICHPLQCIISDVSEQTLPNLTMESSQVKPQQSQSNDWNILNLDRFAPSGGPKDSKIAAHFLFLQAYLETFCTFKLFPLQVSRVWNQVFLVRTDSCYHLALKIYLALEDCSHENMFWRNIEWIKHRSNWEGFSFIGNRSTAKPSHASPLQVALLFCNCFTTNSIHSQAPQVQSWPYFHSAHLQRGQKTGAAKVHALNYENQ